MVTDDGIITNQYKLAKFIPVKDDMIFSVRFLATAVNSITDDDVRLTKRAYIPQNRLRGFESGKIGPTDSGDYIGGNYASALNFNTTLPKVLSDMQNLDFNLFLDAANVWGVDYNSSLDNSKIRSSTGLAVDWLTPIGPLRPMAISPLVLSLSHLVVAAVAVASMFQARLLVRVLEPLECRLV